MVDNTTLSYHLSVHFLNSVGRIHLWELLSNKSVLPNSIMGKEWVGNPTLVLGIMRMCEVYVHIVYAAVASVCEYTKVYGNCGAYA